MARAGKPPDADRGGGERRPFRGFQKPNYTMVPDELFDELLADLNGSELKALLYIVRRTFGFKRDSDSISINQMLEGIRARDGRVLDRGTGLARSTLVAALKSLEARNVIISEKRSSPDQGFEATIYRLNVIGYEPEGRSEIPDTPSTKIELGMSENRTPPSTKIELALVRKSNPQETVKQHTDNSSVVALLRERGISQTIAKRLAETQPEDTIRAKVEVLDYLVETGSPLVERNPAGYLRKAIEEDYAVPAGFQNRAEREAAERERERAEKEAEGFRADHDPVTRAMADYGTTEAEMALWRQVQEQLRLTLAESTYSTYFRNAVLLSLDGNVATLGFPDARARDWATNRLAQSLQRAFDQVLERDITVDSTVLPAVG